MSLTRRDRAACVMAYEFLRAGPVHAFDMLDEAAPALAWTAISEPLNDARDELTCRADAYLLRARLALYLRALLRADAGDDGRITHYWCPKCKSLIADRAPGIAAWFDAHQHADDPDFDDVVVVRRVVSEWQTPNLAARAAEAKQRLAKGAKHG